MNNTRKLILALSVACCVGIAVSSAWASRPQATPESQGVSSAAIMAWADSLECNGLRPQCYILDRNGYTISTGGWGAFRFNVAQELKGLTRVLGFITAGQAVADGLCRDTAKLDRLLARLRGRGDDAATAGGELGDFLAAEIGEAPSYYLSCRTLVGYHYSSEYWDWGGIASKSGGFNFAQGAWMWPLGVLNIGAMFLDDGDPDANPHDTDRADRVYRRIPTPPYVFEGRYLAAGWAKSHPIGTMCHDGRLLAVDYGRRAIAVVFCDTTNDVALASSVMDLFGGYRDDALPEDELALSTLRKSERRPWKWAGPSAPDSFPRVSKERSTYGDSHSVLDMPPTGKVGRNSEGDMIVLKDGRLMLAWSQMVNNGTRVMDNAKANLVKRYSSDGGKTWTAPEVMVTQPPDSLNVMCVNFVRLMSGDIALFYLDKKSNADCRPVMRVSRDEGETWSEPRKIIPDSERGYYVLNNSRVHRMSGGRLAVPVALHTVVPGLECVRGEGWRPTCGLVMWMSDDDGLTWHRSKQVLVPRDSNGNKIKCEEPGVIELKDGRWLWYFRTNDDYQYFAWSSDRGVTWTKARRSTMRSPVAPATIERLSDGRLYAVWNDHSRDPGFQFRFPYHNGDRCPVTLGVSEDEGLNWRPLLDIEREGHFCYFFMREHAGFVYVGYCCEIGMKTQRVVKIPMADIEALRTSSGPLGHRIPLAPDCAIANILFARSRVDRD